jgi:hypothetical protein
MLPASMPAIEPPTIIALLIFSSLVGTGASRDERDTYAGIWVAG